MTDLPPYLPICWYHTALYVQYSTVQYIDSKPPSTSRIIYKPQDPVLVTTPQSLKPRAQTIVTNSKSNSCMHLGSPPALPFTFGGYPVSDLPPPFPLMPGALETNTVHAKDPRPRGRPRQLTNIPTYTFGPYVLHVPRRRGALVSPVSFVTA